MWQFSTPLDFSFSSFEISLQSSRWMDQISDILRDSRLFPQPQKAFNIKSGNRSHITKKCRRSPVSSWEPIAAAPTVHVYYYTSYYEMHARIHRTRNYHRPRILGTQRASGRRARKRGEDIWLFGRLVSADGRPTPLTYSTIRGWCHAMTQSAAKVTVRTRETLYYIIRGGAHPTP